MKHKNPICAKYLIYNKKKFSLNCKYKIIKITYKIGINKSSYLKRYPAAQVQYALTTFPVVLTAATQTLCGVSAIFIVWMQLAFRTQYCESVDM